MIRALVIGVLALCVGALSPAQSYVNISLEGTARGGTLTLIRDLCHGYTSCGILTAPGQSADSVIKRLADAVEEAAFPMSSAIPAIHGSILLDAGVYYLTGCDTGFVVPATPKFLSVNYTDTDSVELNWLPDNMGDLVICVYGSTGGLCSASQGRFTRKNVTSKVYYDPRLAKDCIPSPGDLYYAVSCRPEPENTEHGIESHLRSRFIRIRVSGKKQEDLDNMPFYGNVMPNWEAWSPAGCAEGSLRLLQGEKDNVVLTARTQAFADSPDLKSFYQAFEIKSDVPADGGIYRRYLGLLTGHTYRVYVRFNTFDAEAEEDGWSLSLCAAADPPESGLCPDQLTGRAPLPDGTTGENAGCVVTFGSGGRITGGKWVQVATGAEGAAPDITIPDGSTSLSVWVRVKGESPVHLGMDWSALEDVTPDTER